MSENVITEVQIVPVRPQNGLVGFASCVLNKSLYLGNVGIYTSLSSPGTFRLVFPCKKLRNGKNLDIYYPINSDFANALREHIVSKFQTLMLKPNEKGASNEL